jgi:hypothetical protein
VGFRGDAELTRASGRARLIELALLNAEIDLFESIIARGIDPIRLLDTYPSDPPALVLDFNPGQPKQTQTAPPRPETGPHPSIRAASLETRDHRGTLLLVTDFAAGAQFQPSQMAINDLKIRVNAPQSAQAYDVGLGGVSVLDRVRVPGGIQINLTDFGPTALVLVTTDRAWPRGWSRPSPASVPWPSTWPSSRPSSRSNGSPIPTPSSPPPATPSRGRATCWPRPARA